MSLGYIYKINSSVLYINKNTSKVLKGSWSYNCNKNDILYFNMHFIYENELPPQDLRSNLIPVKLKD